MAVCPSRSKGADLSSAIFVCVGSNPTAANWGARKYLPLWRNRLAHLPSKQGVAGSSPAKGIGGVEFRRYRLMVRTLVFETSNPGSIPGNAILALLV